MSIEHFDVLIIGAGLSGIDAAWHLQRECPQKSYVILENRERIGGTWDLFRYPGIRSDSDMLTMSYAFRPWSRASLIAPGDEIRDYITDTARDAGIDKHIRFRHQVVRADWSSPDARWTITAQTRDAQGHEQTVRFSCGFLLSCAGYYRYSAGYTPELAGIDRFAGTIVHPQKWPTDLDYQGKRVIVIGSGATAVTIVPAMAKTASHVTMLQRSPTYIVSLPQKDRIAIALRKLLPESWVYPIVRWKNLLLGAIFHRLARRRPAFIKRLLLKGVRAHLTPDYDVATHFTPHYNPWDQRICMVPDADLFGAIKEGRASVVTDQIATFTEKGIQLESGQVLEADIIVTATGLVLEMLGGMQVAVDGRAVDFSKTFVYKGLMYTDVPNLVSVFGYTAASWTLRADLVCVYITRLLNRMDEKGVTIATPRLKEALSPEPWLNLASGYIQRAQARLPKQGRTAPWRQNQNYFADVYDLKLGAIEDDALELRT